MKTIAIMACVLLFGCTSQRPTILLQPNERNYTLDELDAMKAQGRPIHTTHWYTAEELDWIARDYAKRESIGFDFEDIQPLIWVESEADFLACIEYGSDIGLPVLIIWIGFDGEVLKHETAIAIDGSAFRHEQERSPE